MSEPVAYALDELPRRRAYVCFSDRLQNGWVYHLTTQGFRHVFLLQPVELGTMIVDPLGGGIFAHWTPYAGAVCAQACADAGMTVLAIDTQPQKTYANYGWQTCVSVVKSLLGVRRFWIITPEQLYRHLMRCGAKEIPWCKRSRTS